jgi:outer membrane protein assembly factor BamE
MHRYILLTMLVVLAGCKVPDVPTVIKPYRIDIQQGNVVTQDMIAKLKPGMTRAQVRFALGSPLVVDPFRTDRWDYVYVFERQGKETERRAITVIFEDDKLVRVEGDVVPAAGGPARSSQPFAVSPKTSPTPKASVPSPAPKAAVKPAPPAAGPGVPPAAQADAGKPTESDSSGAVQAPPPMAAPPASP